MAQSELARVIGVSRNQVEKYERGDDRIDALRLFAIVHALGVAVTEFFDGRA